MTKPIIEIHFKVPKSSEKCLVCDDDLKGKEKVEGVCPSTLGITVTFDTCLDCYDAFSFSDSEEQAKIRKLTIERIITELERNSK